MAGPNGAGKTSLLEGVVLAGTGKVLRSGGVRGAIREGEKGLRVRCDFGLGISAGSIQFEYGQSIRVWALDYVAVKSPVSVYERLPLLVLNPESHYAMLQDPNTRRGIMYWFLFHVEPLFLETWRRYQRVLRQRNAGLKLGDHRYQAFEPGLAQLGEALTTMWARAEEGIRDAFREQARRLGFDGALSTSFRRGWNAESLDAALVASRPGDQRVGFTQVGPHRADIHFLVGGRPIQEVASHGQQKIIVSAWRLAVAQKLKACGKTPVLLIDDLAAELDRTRRVAFYQALEEYGLQAFVTTVAEETFPSSAAVFHVEQGRLSKP